MKRDGMVDFLVDLGLAEGLQSVIHLAKNRRFTQGQNTSTSFIISSTRF